MTSSVQSCHAETALRIFFVHDTSASRGLNKLWVLLFQKRKILLGFPVPDGVRGKDEVHFFQSPLVCLWVQGPDHGDGDDVADAEYVKRFFVESSKHDRAKKSLRQIS